MIRENTTDSPLKVHTGQVSATLSPSLRQALAPGKPKGARELKFLLSLEEARLFEERLKETMAPDPHSVGGGYQVKSLYLDTPLLDVFHRCGKHAFRKYRVRQYGSLDTLFLERKSKKAQRILKYRIEIQKNSLVESLTGPEWFAEEVRLQNLSPVCIIGYQRSAFIGENGDIRVTLDRDLCGHAVMGFNMELEPQAKPVHEGKCVLEFKFLDEIPGKLRALMREFKLRPGAHSKYRGCMSVLGVSVQSGSKTA